MAANTVTIQQVLMKMADDCDCGQTAFVRTVNSQTSLVVTGISMGPRETFKYALATTPGGGIRTVTAHQIASETLTLASGFDVTVAAGNLLQVAWWDPKARVAALAAINEAIRQSWGTFGRESQGATSITLDAGDADYVLPDTIAELWRVGILLPDGSYDWRAPRDLWRISGEAGAYNLRFLDNGSVFLPSAWDGETLYAWYLSKEPEIDAESDTTRLPLDYFSLASYLYLLRRGIPETKDGDPKLAAQSYSAKLAQLKMDADAARKRLARGRPQRPPMPKYERRM